MNLVQFIENRYQELTVELQAEFIAAKDAEIKALHWVLTTYRGIIKWFMIPKVLVQFALVKMGIAKEPTQPLLDKLKAERQKQEGAKLSAVPEPTPSA